MRVFGDKKMASGALGAIVATRFRARPRNLRNAENSPGLSAGKRARGERPPRCAISWKPRSDDSSRPYHPYISHRRNRDDVEEIVLGGGANGITFVDGPRTSVELVGDVAVYFNGTLNEELSNDSESCAHEIWRRYNNRQQYPSESPPPDGKPRAGSTLTRVTSSLP